MTRALPGLIVQTGRRPQPNSEPAAMSSTDAPAIVHVAIELSTSLWRAGLDPCRDPPLPGPGFGAIASLGIAAQHRCGGFGTTHPNIVGGRFDLAGQHGVAGRAEDVVHRGGLAPRHHLGTAVVTVAANGQSGGRPMAADAADQAA